MLDIENSLKEYKNMSIDIRTFRKENKWTQVRLGGLLGVRQAMVSKLERGEVSISKSIAVRLNRLDPERFPLAQLLESGLSQADQAA